MPSEERHHRRVVLGSGDVTWDSGVTSGDVRTHLQDAGAAAKAQRLPERHHRLTLGVSAQVWKKEIDKKTVGTDSVLRVPYFVCVFVWLSLTSEPSHVMLYLCGKS